MFFNAFIEAFILFFIGILLIPNIFVYEYLKSKENNIFILKYNFKKNTKNIISISLYAFGLLGLVCSFYFQEAILLWVGSVLMHISFWAVVSRNIDS